MLRRDSQWQIGRWVCSKHCQRTNRRCFWHKSFYVLIPSVIWAISWIFYRKSKIKAEEEIIEIYPCSQSTRNSNVFSQLIQPEACILQCSVQVVSEPDIANICKYGTPHPKSVKRKEVEPEFQVCFQLHIGILVIESAIGNCIIKNIRTDAKFSDGPSPHAVRASGNITLEKR